MPHSRRRSDADRELVARKAECHPDQPHEAHGQCPRCYQRSYWRRIRRPKCAAPMPLRRPDIDPVAVDRLAAGDRPAEWTVREMTAAVLALTSRGYRRRLIAERLRITTRSVSRHRRLAGTRRIRATLTGEDPT